MMKNWMRSALALLLMLCLVLCPVLVGCSEENSGEKDDSGSSIAGKPFDPDNGSAVEMAVGSVEQVLNELTGGMGDDAAFWERLSGGGSLTISADLTSLMESVLGVGLSVNAEIKCFFTKDGRLVVTADANYMGTSILAAQMYFTETELVVSCPLLLENGAVGISYEDLTALLGELDYGAGDGYYEDDYDYDYDYDYGEASSVSLEMMELLSGEIFAWIEAHADEAEKLAGELVDVLSKAVEENARVEISESTETITAGGVEVAVGKVAVSFDGSEFSAVMEDVVAFLKESKTLTSLMESFFNENEEIAALLLGSGYTSSDVKDYFLEMLDEMLEEIAMIRNDSAVMGMECYLSAKDSSLVSMNVYTMDSYDADERETMLQLSIGEDAATSSEIFLMADSTKLCLERENSGTVTAGRFYMEEYGETDFAVSWSYDENGGAYEIALLADEETIRVVGSLTETADEKTLRVDSVTVEGVTLKLNLLLSMKANDTAPNTPSYKNFMDLSESELSDIMENVEALLSMFGLN